MVDLAHITLLRTQRLAFIHPSNYDLVELYPFFADPAQTRFLFLPPGTPQQQLEFWVGWNYNYWRINKFGICALRSQIDRSLLGMCGVTLQRIDGGEYYEMSCFILPQYRKQGYATEALQTLGDFLTNTTRGSLFNGLISTTTTINYTSWSVSETKMDNSVMPVIVIPFNYPAAQRIAAKLKLILLSNTMRGNELVQLGRYMPVDLRFLNQD
jgi:Acetyltransferase (GNAT) domain